jgi:plastocyanin
MLIASVSLLGAACGEGNKDGVNESGTATTNAAPATGGQAPASKAAKTGGNDTSGSTGSQQIEMGDDVFKPAMLTIPAGTEVTWINKGQKAHTVVSIDKHFDSGLVHVGEKFSYRFTDPGTYSIRCSPHPKMIGQIVVK